MPDQQELIAHIRFNNGFSEARYWYQSSPSSREVDLAEYEVVRMPVETARSAEAAETAEVVR
ncbi:hypothetical protein HRW09_32270 [Streptomyces lunaelactis]|uniref:hypothetical protein n=1 Tax=Streptomyces lunaelactis TaxID=1535768 RepID=UPI001584E2BB|nr:hypothetical protein [Streptomyces lunaelactis]NUL34098.1 hypothetical protein [Streptomyces lunaelactis]